MKNGQFPEVIQLSSLNGQNGFKIDGEMMGDFSYVSNSFVAAEDINGDGWLDVVIGAGGHGNYMGRTYVIFGGPGVGSQGVLALSDLNGSNGFKLDGEATEDNAGFSVSAVGDFNGDSYHDFLIGAPQRFPSGSGVGRSYVVFGGPGVGHSGLLPLSSLNGTNGFRLNGEGTNNFVGWSVSAAGDFNGDGNPDIIIGAIGYNNAIGRSYVVYGGSGVGAGGVVPLTNLNGINGFKLDGSFLITPDDLGYSVSSAGDLNGDGKTDLLIGAYYGDNTFGRAYAVLSGSGIGSGGLLSLSSLNGTQGFVLNGEAMSDYAGISVSGAGNINGDGWVDLIIGAYNHNNGVGRSYVVYGNPGLGGGGVVSLSSLNGINGFKLDGEAAIDNTGYSVHGLGDINGDGLGDLLIGAAGHANNTGRSYVVFGGSKFGLGGIFNLSSLNGANGFKLDGENSGDISGSSVSLAGDINGDGIMDVLIGAAGYANYTGRVYVLFGDSPPVLVNNSLSLSVGATIQLNATYLSAYDRNHNNNTLIFIPDGVTHGQFEMLGAPGIALTNFTQQQMTSGVIQFVHDGTLVAPTYNITVRSNGIAWAGPSPAQINFIGAPQSHFPAIIPLVSLTGLTGFKLDGENNNDHSGYSVNAAGDINGDGYADLLIGADLYPNGSAIGRGYAVFGGSNLAENGVLTLASLNGTNGFKLEGENQYDWCGISVSAAGDVNGDGHKDFLIAAYKYPSQFMSQFNRGRSYVVMGGLGVGGNGLLALASLNGTNGFKLDGENDNDYSGVSVSSAGDINGDGQMDLLIGAYGYSNGKGRSYVLFGGRSVGSNNLIALASLNGTEGFKLTGENNADQSGISVSAAGDINGDGYADLLIGAFGYSSNRGRSYVVFGGSWVGNIGDIELGSLNGTNGFKLDGENSNDWSGYSVSAAGDINGDGHNDLLIGGLGYPSSSAKGRSYVVFGGPGVSQNGTIALSSLNGTNGFKIDGENNGDSSGESVSSAGDVNADGYADLLIGAYGYPGGNNIGRSYVVFGGVNIGYSGIINLSELNGNNGFKIDGEIAGDFSGESVNAAGDINGDGIADMVIGAYGHNNATGRSYVIFGDIPPVLVQNRLTLQQGGTLPINSSFLSAYDLNHNNNTLVFIPSNVTHGEFELVSQPGVALSNFTQTQLVSGSVQFVHDGSGVAPSYDMTVRSAGIAWTGPSTANITFIPATTTAPTPTPTSTPSPTQTSTPSTVVPTTTSVSVTTSTPIPSTVAPTTTSAPATTSTPSLTPTPSSSTVSSTTVSTPVPTSTPSITPAFSPVPMLVKNQLSLGDGQTIVLSSGNLQATESGFNISNLVFYISNIQNGYFSLLPTNASVTRFLQSYVQNGQVQFMHSGDHQAPSYSVVVSDGSQATAPSPASITFIGAPSVTTTPITVTQGGSTTLTTSNLNVTNTGGSSSNQIVFQVNNVQHGQFELNGSSTSISNFTLTQLTGQNVQLVQDNSNIAPSYSVSVTSDTGLSSAATPVTAQLCTSLTSSLSCAPVIVRNNLWVKQGESATLSSQNLYVTTTSGQTLPASNVFYVTNVNHGYFNVNGSSSSFFTEQQLQEGVVQFVDDGSNVAPSYQIAVQSSGLQTNSLAQVTLGFVNKPPYLSGVLPNQVAAVGQPFTLAIGPSVFTDPQGDPLILSADLYNSTQPLPAWLSFNPSTNRFSGTPIESEVIDISLIATDPEGLSTEGEFSLTVLGQSSGGNNSLTTAIASSVASGTIGLFFLLLKICLQRAANRKLDQALGEAGDYEQKVVRPLGRAIAQRLKITGFMGHTTNKEMLLFKDAVRTLLGSLSDRGIDLEDPQLNESRRAYLINEIAVQTKEYFLPSSRHCCRKSYRPIVSFFTSEVTPRQISTAAATIADAVVQAQRQHKSSTVQLGLVSSSQSGRMSPPTVSPQLEETIVASLS